MKKSFLLMILSASVLFTAFSEARIRRQANPDFNPALPEKIPVIKIKSETGKNDFASKPVAAHVTESRKSWGEFRNDPAPYYEKCTITINDGSKSPAISNASAKVKVRGNWTTDYPKKPLRIRFDEKQSVLGINNGNQNRDWVLLAGFKDWSLTRDAVGLYIGNLISPGYTSDFKFVEVEINGKPWGLYLLAELMETGKNKINVTEPKKDYAGTDIGYFLEMDGYAWAEKNAFEINHGCKLKDINGNEVAVEKLGYTIKSQITNDSQKAFIGDYMDKVWKICYEAAYNWNFLEFDRSYNLVKSSATNPYDCISKVIDMESLISTYVITELVVDPDLYYSSFYFSVDFGPGGDKKIHFEAPWDFDSGLGNKNFCADGKGLHAAVRQWDVNHQEPFHANPWMMVFVNHDWFQKAVKNKWAEVQEIGTLDKLLELIDFVTKKYAKSIKTDQKVWKNIGDPSIVGHELCDASKACKTQQQAAERLKGWLKTRFAYLDSIWKTNKVTVSKVTNTSYKGIKFKLRNVPKNAFARKIFLNGSCLADSAQDNDQAKYITQTEYGYPFTEPGKSYKFDFIYYDKDWKEIDSVTYTAYATNGQGEFYVANRPAYTVSNNRLVLNPAPVLKIGKKDAALEDNWDEFFVVEVMKKNWDYQSWNYLGASANNFDFSGKNSFGNDVVNDKSAELMFRLSYQVNNKTYGNYHLEIFPADQSKTFKLK